MLEIEDRRALAVELRSDAEAAARKAEAASSQGAADRYRARQVCRLALAECVVADDPVAAVAARKWPTRPMVEIYAALSIALDRASDPEGVRARIESLAGRLDRTLQVAP